MVREEMEEEVQKNGGGRRNMVAWECLQPYVLNVFSNFCFAGYNIVSKVYLDKGMSQYILVVYGHAIGTLITSLLVLLFERANGPKINRPILLNTFFLGVLGPVLGRTMFYAGLLRTSPTIASAMGNLIPSITFILAVLCRMEKVEISMRASQAKIGGTVVALAGATLATLYKGIIVISPLRHHGHDFANQKVSSVDKDWIKGSLMLTTSYLSLAAFYILQTATIKKYPAPLKLTSLICLMGTLQATAVTLVLDRKASSWRLKRDISLLAPLYSGIMIFGVTIYVQILVIQKKGPVFMTAFRPLCTIIVAVMAMLILGEALHLGSLIGSILIFVGLYVTLWGKETEKKKKIIEKEGCNEEGAEMKTSTAPLPTKEVT